MHFFIEKKLKELNYFLLIVFFLYLEYIFPNVLVEYFPGYTYSFDLFKYIETKAILVLIFIYMNITKPSDFIYGITFLLFIFFLIPNLVIFEFMESPRAIIYGIVYTIILLLTLKSAKISIAIPEFSVKNKIYWMLAITILMLIPCVLVYKNNLHYELFFFNSQKIYDIRAGNFGKESFLSGYFFSWLVKIALPVLLVFGIIFKKKFLIFLSIACLLYLYLTTAHKSVFIGIFAILLLCFYKKYSSKIFYLLLGLLSLCFISRFVSSEMDNLMLESIAVRRTFFDPALSNIYYFDFFKNDQIYLSHSVFKSFIPYPFEEIPEKIISEKYFNFPNGNANNGLISDAFMNFGTIGILFYGFVFALLIRLFDSFRINSSFFGIFLVIIYTFISSFFLTTLLTHGVLLFLIISVFFLREPDQPILIQKKDT